MAILTRKEALAILEKVVGYSEAEGCQVTLQGSEDGNIRFARNTVTTSGEVTDRTLEVSSSFGQRQGTATVNELSEESMKAAVRRSEELARLAPENPEFMPYLGAQEYLQPSAWYDATEAIDPDFRAQAAGHSIGPCREKKLVAAGYLEDSRGFTAIMTSGGLTGFHRATTVGFSLTVRSPDGTGSGYVTCDYNNAALFDSATSSATAIDKAIRSREPRAIEPGKYTVILEPAASSGLLANLMDSLGARRADEGRSFLSRAGGGTLLGEKLVDERVTITSDPTDARVPAAPWSEDGRPNQKTTWLEKGVLKNLSYSRYWASEKEVAATPEPANTIMAGGDATLEALIKDTKKGVLVTRTWYIRSVDPQTLLYTGLTRDGTFFIEDGKIAFPIKNMRFNESPIIMLNNLEALGRPERIDGNLIPPMKVRDFTFTSLSDAV